jgi:nucleotide-binding universal stress UspA family protein
LRLPLSGPAGCRLLIALPYPTILSIAVRPPDGERFRKESPMATPTQTTPSSRLPLPAEPEPAPAVERILVATDLGEAADGALRIAQARVCAGACVAVCHVVETDDPATVMAARHEVEGHVRAVIGDRAVDCSVLVEAGDPAETIARHAREWGATLIVVGGSRRPDGTLSRLLHGDIVTDVVRKAPCAVLVSRRSSGTGRILVGTDLSDPSLPAVRAAAAEQARTGAKVTLIHCVHPSPPVVAPDMLEASAASIAPEELEQAVLPQLALAAAQCGLDADLQVVFSPPARALVDLAAALAADLVIVGTHGRTGFKRLLLGSTAETVVRDAISPVLVVRLES